MVKITRNEFQKRSSDYITAKNSFIKQNGFIKNENCFRNDQACKVHFEPNRTRKNLRKCFRVNFYTEKSFVIDNFNVGDYYITTFELSEIYLNETSFTKS